MSVAVSLAVLLSVRHNSDLTAELDFRTRVRACAVLLIFTTPPLALLVVLWLDRKQVWKSSTLVIAAIVSVGLHVTALALGFPLLSGHELAGSARNAFIVFLAWNSFLLLLHSALYILVAVLYLLGSTLMFKPAKAGAPSADAAGPFNVDLLSVPSSLLPAGSPLLVLGMSELPGRKQHNTIRDVEADMAAVGRNGYEMHWIVSLNRPCELEFMGYTLDDLKAAGDKHGVESIQFEVRDKFIPDDFEAYAELIALCCHKLLHKAREVAASASSAASSAMAAARRDQAEETKQAEQGALIDSTTQPVAGSARMLFHCKGGKGRTGTAVVAAQLLLNYIELQCRADDPSSAVGPAPTLSISHLIRQTRAARSGTIRNPLQQLFLYEFRARLPQLFDQIYLGNRA